MLIILYPCWSSSAIAVEKEHEPKAIAEMQQQGDVLIHIGLFMCTETCLIENK